MTLNQRLEIPSPMTIDLIERVRLIVELWGRRGGLDGDRVAEIARNLYGTSVEEVREALIKNLRDGKIKGVFSAVDPP
jgi:hypothetical protein